MRLLHLDDNGHVLITDDVQPSAPYAILSHRWTSEEVTYTDIINRTGHMKSGYHKLRFCALQAEKDGLKYFWIDSCCIDKSNLAELSRAITSMYRWYAESRHCYVYLGDVTGTIGPSNWFTRGWTLQELLAPSSVKFFDHLGAYIGDRQHLVDALHSLTGIQKEALSGKPMHEFSVEQRFAWSASRHTTEPEDIAYSLQGIFDVSMPPLYGEGRAKALDRLKMSISRKLEVDIMKLNIQPATPPPVRNFLGIELPRMHLSDRIVIKADREKRRKEIIKHLRFDAMERRRGNIEFALDKTCRWLLDIPLFKQWRNRQVPFIWIKGHPGVGKSTLMKFADYQIAADDDDTAILISFYFHARGELLERSVPGLYRSLIVQLFRSIPDLDNVLDNLKFQRKTLPDPSLFKNASLPVLRELFTATIAAINGRHVYCMIDALDETNVEEVLEMAEFLQNIGGPLSVCFASRHYPTLDLGIPEIIVEREEGHNKDLQLFVDAKSRFFDSQLCHDILKKANGIFMWVVLVVGILNREYRQGSLFGVRQKLNDLPPTLADLLKDIASRDGISDDAFTWCLQLIMFVERPLDLSEFYFAMVAGLDEKASLFWDRSRLQREHMEHFLITHSKGLAESRGKVQFIHESIRDFLVSEHSKQLFNKNDTQLLSESAASDRLALACWRTFKAGCTYWGLRNSHLLREELLRNPSKCRTMIDSDDLPFFSYSAQSGLNHDSPLSSSHQVIARDPDYAMWHTWMNFVVTLNKSPSAST